MQCSDLRQAPLRPSSLPKMAECVWFRSPEEKYSEAALRGTSVDRLYRDMIEGKTTSGTENPDDINAADWAVMQTQTIADGRKIIARKSKCQVSVPGFPSRSEVDA